jgi:uncharacterized repeat protein (TIGR01451 family)
VTRISRALALGVAGALLVPTLGLSGAAFTSSALAAPADDCAAPTRVVAGTGDGTPVTVGATEVVLVTGTVDGGVDALPAGGTLCVAAGATLSPGYVNNPAGTVHVAAGGTAALPAVAVSTGFVLDNAGTVTVAGLNVNGPAQVRNAAGASLTITGGFAPAAGTFRNAGTFVVQGPASFNSGVTLVNDGDLTVAGATTVDGPFENRGTALVQGGLTVNGSGTLTNRCVLRATGDLLNGGRGSTSSGRVAVDGAFRNNGSWRQAPTGALSAASLTDDGDVTGYGRYAFTGATSVQGTFRGDDADRPIVVDVPGATFPTSGAGVVENVRIADLTLPAPRDYPAPECSDPAPRPGADVQVAKTGPATVVPDGAITYTITVSNAGLSAAEGVVVTDALPAGLAGATASDGGVVGAGTVTWSLGTLAPGATRTLTLSGTAPASGTLVNTVRAESATPDPDPSNNDGTAPAETVVTQVTATPAGVGPPTAQPGAYRGPVDLPVLGRVTGTSPDPGLQLRYAVTSGPSSGRVVMLPSGLFVYQPDPGFLGTDVFTFQVCDNQTPAQCDDATVVVTIYPVVVPDEVTTRTGAAIDIPVSANDTPGAVLTSAGLPTHGGAVVVPGAGTVRYDPGAYLGDVTFTYTSCAPPDRGVPGTPPECATTDVVVHVIPTNDLPVPDPVSLVTPVDVPVSGPLTATDPDGDAVAFREVFPPLFGQSSLDPGRALTTYTPPPGFTGRDTYFYTACDDGTPSLCATGVVTALVLPLAVDDTATTPAGTPVTIEVEANDRGTVLAAELVTPPAHGTAEPGGSFVYTPAAGFVGTDTFTYRICSPDRAACAEAVVTVVVTGPPAPGGPAEPTEPGEVGGAGPSGGAPAGSDSEVLAVTGTEAAATTSAALVLLGGGALLVALTALFRRHRPGR